MKNLSRSYIIALTFIAIVILLGQFLVQRNITNSKDDSRIINISGRQRMLSQKISKAALSIYLAPSQAQFDKSKNELTKAVNLWQTSHEGLQLGSEDLGITEAHNSETIKRLFKEINPYYAKMKVASDRLLSQEFETRDKSEMGKAANVILNNEATFLKLMNDITFQYDSEASEKVQSLSKTEYILLAIALILLFLEAFLIFRPAIRRVNQYTKELVEKEKVLQVALENETKEKEKVAYLNRQSETVFANVEQGIFLIDEKNNISDQHSKSLEKILGIEHLEGKNFVQVMKSKLINRDLEALEMFLKHLYNPKIDNDTLLQLNPLEEMEIFSDDKPGMINSQYIQAKFVRISEGDTIQNVLVTVSDISESILLQKEIQEAEEKNKKDAVQLVSILKIDPVALKQYLSDVRVKLKSISHKYENSDSNNLMDLVNFTFNTIHNLKGNAQLIDLELISDNLQSTEETILELKGKSKLQGNDFLRILFQINETDKMADNMLQMLNKISEIKTQINDSYEVNVDGSENDKFVESLTKGVEKIASDLGVKAKLEFEDNGVAIPDHYMLPIKDVLVQLIRNSLVHGKEGDVTLSVELKKDAKKGIQITYKDDGKGLDVEKIKEKAIDKKIVTEEELAAMDVAKVQELIFDDGFSTLDEGGKYAGMGQGLSLVKSIINQHEGNFKVDSKTGEFFKLEMTLPKKEEKITA